jgi:penicillin-binding protein 1A
MARKKQTRKRPRKKKKAGRIFKALKFTFFLLLFPLAVGASIGGLLAFARTVPSIAELRQDITPPSTRIYADDDTLIGELKVLKGKHVPYKKMPPDLINAVVSVEDASFWQHRGVDYLAIMRAAMKDILKRHLKEGGSTITQQLAKIAFLTPEKTFKRKIKEFVLAHRIEKELTKEEILEIYLNRAYFGHGAYGVEMASRVHFGKSVNELTLPEAALMAGLLKAPSAYSPIKNFDRSKSRQMHVLRRMEEEGYINRRQIIEAEKAEIVLHKGRSDPNGVNYYIEYVKQQLIEAFGEEMVYKGGLRVYTSLDRHAQAAAQRAVQKGLRNLDKRRGWRGPIAHKAPEAGDGKRKAQFKIVPPNEGDIVTGVVRNVGKDAATVKTDALIGKIPLKNAKWAESFYDEEAQEFKKVENFDLANILRPGDVIRVMVKSMSGDKVEFALEQEPEVQGALVAIEPYSGFIKALVGGYDYSLSEFNRALRAKRQAGSAFKPIIYALALKSGYTPASIIEDEEVSFDKETGKMLRPEDILEMEEEAEAAALEAGAEAQAEDVEDIEEGEEEEEEKIWTPRNYDEKYHGPTRLRDALAYSRNVVTVRLVDQIGVSRLIKFARSLGIQSEMQYDLSLSLGSLSISPLELTSSYGTFANNGAHMTPLAIKYVTDRRGKVIKSNTPQEKRVLDPQTSFLITSMMKDAVSYGTGWRARALRRPVAGKTGTTNEYRDAWFLGFTTDMVAGVWVGFDDMKPLGKEETGSRAAAPIWVSFMKDVVGGSEPREFPIPDGIVSRLIDPATGLLANKWTEGTVLEHFKEGTEPTDYSPSIWQINEPANLIF